MRAPRTPRLRGFFAGTPTRPAQAARRQSQAGFTLIELIIASALGLLVLSALTSVVLTTSMATNTAVGRIEASSQVRSFQFTAYDDFALARAPAPSGCGTPGAPCTTQEMVLQGSRVPNQVNGVAVPSTVRYIWDAATHLVTRYTGTSSRVAANHVTAYSWYIEGGGSRPSVVVSLTVTIASYNVSYSESQTFRFSPQITATPSP
jgi:prepilin-type N-terminal cleavage/methylation domain-containing protein